MFTKEELRYHFLLVLTHSGTDRKKKVMETERCKTINQFPNLMNHFPRNVTKR